MNAAAAAYTGGQRAASQSSCGNSIAAGSTVAHNPGGRAKIRPLATARTTSATAPSISSRRGRGSRNIWASPISSGAIVTTPSPSDVNHTCQMLSTGAVVWNSVHRHGSAGGGGRGSDGRRQQKAQHSAQGIEPERLTEPPADEPRRKQGLAGIAKAAEQRRPEVPVAQEIGSNGRDDDADRHRRPRARPQCQENADGDARGWPEDRHTLQLGEQHEAQPRRQKIGDGGEDACCDCFAPRPPRQAGDLVLDVYVEPSRHIAPPTAPARWHRQSASRYARGKVRTSRGLGSPITPS